jgi:hypothetical protein
MDGGARTAAIGAQRPNVLFQVFYFRRFVSSVSSKCFLSGVFEIRALTRPAVAA